jgi:hypothetical protein
MRCFQRIKSQLLLNNSGFAEMTQTTRKVEARTAELIEDERSLCDLRRALALTQEKMAEELGIGQEHDLL